MVHNMHAYICFSIAISWCVFIGLYSLCYGKVTLYVYSYYTIYLRNRAARGTPYTYTCGKLSYIQLSWVYIMKLLRQWTKKKKKKKCFNKPVRSPCDERFSTRWLYVWYTSDAKTTKMMMRWCGVSKYISFAMMRYSLSRVRVACLFYVSILCHMKYKWILRQSSI